MIRSKMRPTSVFDLGLFFERVELNLGFDMEFVRSLPKVVVFNGILIVVLTSVLIFPKDCSLSSLFSDKRPIDPGKQKSAIEIQNSFRNVYHFAKDSVVSIRTKRANRLQVRIIISILKAKDRLLSEADFSFTKKVISSRTIM